jgi:hypothetical protein
MDEVTGVKPEHVRVPVPPPIYFEASLHDMA